MLDVLISKSITDNDINPIKNLPDIFLSEFERKAKDFLLDYNDKYKTLPDKERFEETEFGHYLTDRLQSSPIDDIFDQTLEDIKQRHFTDQMHVLQEKMYNGLTVDYNELVGLGKTLSRTAKLGVTDIFNLDRTKLYAKEKDDRYIDFGFYGLDAPTGGIAPGEYCILAARPGVGKSLISFYEGLNWARQGKKVLIVSAEMAIVQIASRIDGMLGSFNPLILRTKENPSKLEDYYNEVQKELNSIKNAGGNLIFPYQGNITPNMIETFLENNPVDVLIVDGVYLLGDDRGYNNDWQHQSNVTNKIKQIGLDFNIPILGTTQFKRAGKIAGFDLEDIAGSDDYGKTADMVLAAYTTQAKTNRVEIEFIKNRIGGKLGSVSLDVDWNNGVITEHIPTLGKAESEND